MWFSVHIGIVEHPKLAKLTKKLGCSRAEAVGLLDFLWTYGIKYADKIGNFGYIEKSDIEAYIDYENRGSGGVKGKEAVEAFIKTGWLEETAEGLKIHDWEAWQEPWYKDKEKKSADSKRYIASKATKTVKKEPEIEQITLIQDKQKKSTKAEYAEKFEEFWKVYPRKEGKEKAYECYLTRIKEGYSPEEILECTFNYIKVLKERNTEKKYIKQPQRFVGCHHDFLDYKTKKEVKMQDLDAEDQNPFAEWA